MQIALPFCEKGVEIWVEIRLVLGSTLRGFPILENCPKALITAISGLQYPKDELCTLELQVQYVNS